jgi:hypothetical protein
MIKKEYKEELKKVCIKTTFCDKCGEDTDIFGFSSEINLQTWEDINEYGYEENYRVDLCITCSRELFKTTLPSLGINTTNSTDTWDDED